MLKLGRVDAVISNAAQTALAQGGARYSAADFSASSELGRISCGVFLAQSNGGARLLSAINVVISDMYLDGSYCDIMKNSKVTAIPCNN